MGRRSSWRPSFAVLMALAAPVGAEVPVVRDQSNLYLDFSYNVSDNVLADDFVLTSETRLTSAKIWLSDNVANDNGALDGFSGVIGWAIYADGGGKPGVGIQAGRSIGLVSTDSGLQEEDGPSDVFVLRFDLEPSLSLEAGTYWFAVKEGPWGQAADGTILWWQSASTLRGAAGHLSPEETGPVNWSAALTDFTYSLYGMQPIWDLSQGWFTGRDGSAIGSNAEASDFSLSASTRLSAFDVWLADGNSGDDGTIGTFSGTLGWAIYADNGSGKPGALLHSGQDPAPLVVDTGEQGSSFRDIARVRVRLGRSLTLAAGDYWLALHEGAWGSSFDGTEVYWVWALKGGGELSWGDAAEANPTTWDLGPNSDTAFVLFEETIFGSGFEAGTGCAWSGPTNDCP